jgi:hypothetical protein
MKKALILLIGIVVIGLGFLAFGLSANNVVPQRLDVVSINSG